MKRLMRLLGGLALLALSWVALVFSHWFPVISDEDVAAMALLAAVSERPLGERNAFPAMWLHDYDIEEAEIAATMAADVARFWEHGSRPQTEPFVSVAAERGLPSLPEESKASACYEGYWHGGSCLAEVRAETASFRAVLDKQARRLQRENRFANYDHIATEFPRSLRAPLVGPRSGGLVRTAAALHHVSGNSTAAIEQLCRHTRDWRQLLGASDNSVVNALTLSQLTEHVRLAAEILAEQPELDQHECLSAFAPLQDAELEQCAAMAGAHKEYAGTLTSSAPRFWDRWINTEHLIAKSASELAFYCQAAHRSRLALRSPTPPPPKLSCNWMEKLFDPAGCRQVSEQSGMYEFHYLFALDFDARLRLFNAARWIRTRKGSGSLTELISQLPAQYRTDAQQITVYADVGVLGVTGPGQRTWRIPVTARPVPP